MVKKISIAIVMIVAFIALLQGNAFAAEMLPEAVDGVITLTENVELAKLIVLEKSVTVDLNGYNITRSTAGDSAAAFYINNPDVVLTIKGEGIVSAHGPAVWANGGKVILESGTYTSYESSTIFIEGNGSAEVLNGTFKNEGGYYLLNLRDKDRGTASIKVTGGKFIKWNPAYNGAEGIPTDFVKEGYKAVENNGDYEVVVDEEYNFRKALAVGGTVKLTSNIELTKLIVLEKSVTVDLNGYNITRSTAGDSAAAFYINNPDVVLTIKGEGIVSAHGPAVWANGGKVILESGTYTSYESSTIFIEGNGSAEVLNGTFKNEGGYYLLNLRDKDRGTASIKVTGGKFIKWNPAYNGAEGIPTDFVKEGYKAVENNGDYEVVCAHKTCAKEAAKPATYVETGSEAYYVCNICSKWFKTWSEGKEATDEITDKSSIVIPKLIEVNDKKDEVVVKNEAVDNAVADATANNTDVVIPLGNIGTTVSSVELPVEKLEVVAGTDKALVVETTEAVVTIDNKALEEVVKQAGAEPTITLEVKKVEEKVLSETQQAVIENKEVAFVFTAEMLANGKEISNFNGGKVKLAIPFTPAENTNASDYKVFYIADDGSISEVLTQYVDGKIVVELEHFSEYALINVNKVANQGGTGSAAPAPATKDNTPKTGATSVVVAMMAIAGAGYMLTRKEER